MIPFRARFDARQWASKEETPLLQVCYSNERSLLGASVNEAKAGDILVFLMPPRDKELISRYKNYGNHLTEVFEKNGELWAYEFLGSDPGAVPIRYFSEYIRIVDDELAFLYQYIDQSTVKGHHFFSPSAPTLHL